MSDASAHLPAWVRRRDGSPAPFDADRICQSLYAAAESLGAANAFLSRELTDVVLHFLPQENWGAIPRTSDIAEQVEKIVREVGQPELARRYAELQLRSAEPPAKTVTLICTGDANQFTAESQRAYALEAIFSRDVAAAVRDELLCLGDGPFSRGLASYVVETPRLAELPWWLALDDWHAVGGEHWIVDSPDWLCTVQRHPALTPHLCERLLALPTLAQRSVELHLNIAEAPSWALIHPARPLFGAAEDDGTQQDRANFLDSLLERWKALHAPRVPRIAWHLHEQAFREETQRRQLRDLIRLALQGKPIRFVFDRPRVVPALAEGMDRKCPGVLLEVGLDLARFADRPDIGWDGAVLLKKLPSLARIAVSAAQQKLRYLRGMPADAPIKRSFLLDRVAGMVVPIGVEEVVRKCTGAGWTQSPLALDFALEILHTLRSTLLAAGRAGHLDLRLDNPVESAPAVDATDAPRRQLELAGKLHARAGAGAARLLLTGEADADPDRIASLLESAWSSTGVLRLHLQRAAALRQGELPI